MLAREGSTPLVVDAGRVAQEEEKFPHPALSGLRQVRAHREVHVRYQRRDKPLCRYKVTIPSFLGLDNSPGQSQ